MLLLPDEAKSILDINGVVELHRPSLDDFDDLRQTIVIHVSGGTHPKVARSATWHYCLSGSNCRSLRASK
jgi:hypothetical protein